jgi:sugar-phosphatase
MAQTVNLTCKAVLFDMDGTLVDSTPVVVAGWKWWAAKHNIPLQSILAFSHGRPGSATMEHFLPGYDHTNDLAELTQHEETNLDGIAAIAGALELVHALQGHPWAIVTSAWRTLAESRVAAAGFPLPKVIVPIDEIRKGKPDPEGFLHAAKQLRIAPEHCLVFEDTRPGIEAALNAGMQAVGLLTTLPADHLKHSPLIRDFRDVTVTPDGDSLRFSIKDHSA